MSLVKIEPVIEETKEVEAVCIDGEHLESIVQKFKHVNDKDKAELIKTAMKTVGHCINPLKAEKFFKSILCLGKVQSGKTTFMLTSMALAFDNKIDIGVIFAGDKISLLSQSNVRTIECIDVSFRGKVYLVTTANSVNDLDKDKILNALRNGKKIIISIIKNRAHIQKLNEVLCSQDLKSYKTVVFDDEGDVATFNYKKGKKTPTYRQITHLLEGLDHCTYFCMTATPQAILLLQKVDDLQPMDTVLVRPGSAYTGGSVFHGAEQNKYMRVIPEKDMNFEDELEADSPLSFWKALCDFLIGSAYRTLEAIKNQEKTEIHSMLVHTSARKKHHIIGELKINKLIKLFQDSLAGGLLPHSKIYYLLKESYEDLVSKFPSTYPNFNEFLEQVKCEVNDLEIHVVHSKPGKSNVDYATKTYNCKNNIFVGGNLLGRGLTIPNLAVSYIYRNAKTPLADTTEQRARWLGYKKSYLCTCRVYAPKDLIKIFSNLLGHEDDLWEQIEKLQKKGIKIEDWSVRKFVLGEPMKLTMKRVGNSRRERFVTWKNFAVPMDSEIHSVLDKLFYTNSKIQTNIYGRKEHYSIKLSVSDLYNIIKKHDQNDYGFHDVCLALKDLISIDRTRKVDCLLLDKGNFRGRKISEDGEIKRLHQGSSDKLPKSDPRYYCGDKGLVKGELQIQMSNLKIKNEENLEYLGISIYYPKNLKEKLVQRIKTYV
ncbi:hypothetical protein DMN50_09060 [Priestia megaterium]|nr:hypothetical protein DMN50_09060 [Priestia megaterium]